MCSDPSTIGTCPEEARCPGSVLKCLYTDATKTICVPPAGANANATKVEPTFDCCMKYVEKMGQIPTLAEFTEDYITGVRSDGYILNNGDPTTKEGYWPKSTPDDPTTDNVLNAKSHLGFFNGIVPNYITGVKLTTGLEILVRVWKPGNTATALGRIPLAQEQYDSICNTADISTYADGRGWCWRRGQIAAAMGNNEYVVKLSQESFGLIKSVKPADVRPLCFEGEENVHNQAAECSTSSTCTNFAGTSQGLSYQLGDKVVLDMGAGKASVKTISEITDNKFLFANDCTDATKAADCPKPSSPESLIKCADPMNTGNKKCSNNPYADDGGRDEKSGSYIKQHYGIEAMQLSADFTSYQKGTLTQFSADVTKAKLQTCSASSTVTIADLTPICYDTTPLV